MQWGVGDALEWLLKTKSNFLCLFKICLKLNPKTLFTIGSKSKVLTDNLKNSIICKHYKNVKLFEKNFYNLVYHNDIVFVKGSNGTGLYKFCKNLEKKYELGE